MSNKRNEVRYDVPDIVVDPGTKKRYRKGKFLGRVSFFCCLKLSYFLLAFYDVSGFLGARP